MTSAAGFPHGGDAQTAVRSAEFLRVFDGLLAQVEEARQADAYPLFPCFERVDGSAVWIDGRRHITLAANNYLGLAGDLRIVRAAQEAIARFGASGCGSPLSTGYTRLHAALEADLAAFLERPHATVFASGYQANVGIIAALMQRGDLIVSDLFNHASIIDGARLSGAEVRFFQHNDPGHLESVLTRAAGRRVLVVVEGIYSVDGDIAPLADICPIARRHGAAVMVDEAHSLGVLGRSGRGAVEHFGVGADVDLVMGTMSKSLGSVGGFVAGEAALVDVVRHRARSLVFSAALPAGAVAAAAAALEILGAEPERRERLWQNTRRLLDGLAARGFDTMRSASPVVPVRVGDPLKTIQFARRLRDRGVLVCPVVPPMVQGHLSRLRLHASAAHGTDELDRALATITAVGEALGLIRAGDQEANER